jgi:hypothetical protein
MIATITDDVKHMQQQYLAVTLNKEDQTKSLLGRETPAGGIFARN